MAVSQNFDRVPRIVTAYCPACESRYGYHDGGRCVHCASTLDVSVDREAFVTRAFEEKAAELGREHAPDADADYPVCRACVECTPLALTSSADVVKARYFEGIVTAAAVHGAPQHARRELANAYTDAYFGACAPPAECFVCHDAAHSDSMECGHRELGDPCPVAGE